MLLKNMKVLVLNVKDSQAFVEYSNNMQDVYKKLSINTSIKYNALIVYDHMIVDLICNKKLVSSN